VSPIGGEGYTARRARCIEWLTRASHDGDQHNVLLPSTGLVDASKGLLLANSAILLPTVSRIFESKNSAGTGPRKASP
jgi:hypothetical protein